ncbi:membrane-targeted effector domain-containing toxin [Pseudomonas fluorescens]|uniref:membrane-targeted effector domain-containing toxin n=1 Tax=Pseudomonas fluorescens TaxID=294 RepID=UPI001785D820|nr:membrane-targeted effector domain-containing toxin [Pseudomonas fluorescens]MBD8151214.1 membrane-targeted effector domain-containing toxin [Pseudomonas fluorescens]MBD8175519.1 membrane-targeted effector domain-containing toxin [Pseudomonas fluorescens]MBD8743974.1 membrane-targeted effector domain-containing toxin [Pseudomonas fluorescens]MBD8750250.1 membrane-targeted effector domain-containing toxin [Pseudomonas fluorescens]MBD8759225.1 membrane-targeted effector domain-containing toxin
MSTPTNLAPSPTFQEIRIHLLEIDPHLRAQARHSSALPQELLALEALNTALTAANDRFVKQARRHFEALNEADLTQERGKTLLATLKANLNKHLQTLDETSTVNGQGLKSYIIQRAGLGALEQQTRLDVHDYLLPPAAQGIVEDCSRGPAFRPGMYSLNFSYQDHTVEFAGAFVLTRKPTPVVDNLTSAADLGQVLLFTPHRGLEAFDSLAQLDQRLKATLAFPAGLKEFCRHLPVRYQALDVDDIWPLQLLPIDGEPLFEHTYNAIIDKRSQDVELALSLIENPQHEAALLQSALDNAVKAALPDVASRLALRRQRLLERSIYNGLPGWYRNATATDQHTLSRFIQDYNQARATYIELLGPVASPQALADFQLTEYLDEALEIHDLDPRRLTITTRRNVAHVGAYEQTRNLVQLSYDGLHTGDELPGSDFLTSTTLTYAGAALQGEHAVLDAQSLLDMLREPGLQPRLDFAALQKEMQSEIRFRKATRDLFDHRLVLLAFIARLRGDLSQADHALFDTLRAGTNPLLCARTVLLHGAQLKDLWLVREEDVNGQTRRLLLCTPDSPRERQFLAFTTERECQAHIIGWADDRTQIKGRTMSDYLLEQCPLRFRPKMGTFLAGLGFKPDAQEHEEVTFGPVCSHTVCLDAMVIHSQSAAQDDYEHSTPLWYRSATAADRARLTSLAEDAAGALRVYNASPDSEANFTPFNAYLHAKAKLSLNTLLGRTQQDIDPDTVYISAPWPLLGGKPKPISYTRLYRDGYTNNVGFIDPKFSTSATFSGPVGVDLSRLTPQNVSRSVTGVWIGQRYTDEVRAGLQSASSPGYARRRDATLAITQLQMKYAALNDCLRGHIARVDLRWLERAIDSLGSTVAATRNTYKVHRLTIDGDWVMGNYLFSHATYPVLLYTPNAPDGIGFREAKLFNHWLKKVDGVSDYLQGRVPVQSRARIGTFLKTARAGLPETIDRTTPSPARYDTTTPHTTVNDPRHDLYNMVLQRKIDDVVATTVNRTEMIMGILWTCVELVTAIATIPFPVLSLGLGGLLAFKDAMLAISAYQKGDVAGALKHYIGYLANVAGAVLFDFRPALDALPLRPVTRAIKHATLINDIDPGVVAGMKPVLFDGHEFWVKNTPDSLGRHLLFRHDPVTGHMQSTARLVNQNTDGHWVRSGVAGGGRRKTYAVLQEEVDQPLARYEIASTQGKYFRSALDPKFRENLVGHPDSAIAQGALDRAYLDLKPLRQSYSNQVEQLTQDAQALYASPPARPDRTGLPVLAADSSPSTALAALFPIKKRLIIGASNTSVASKQLLIEDMQALAAQGLKRVYIENLPADVFRNKLNIINGQTKGNLTHALKQVEDHLARVDAGLGWSADAPFTYRKLMLEAHKNRVAIDGVDASSSYHMEHVLELSDKQRFIPRHSQLRNYYSHKTLAQSDPDEGWIALVSHDRIGSTDEVPGLADLQHAIALRVDDAAPGQAAGIVPDTSSTALSRGDYRLTMATTSQTLPTPGPSKAVPPLPSPSHYSAFDLPATFKPDLDEMVHRHDSFDILYGPRTGDPYHPAHQAFKQTRSHLDEAAKQAFTAYTPPPRPDFADLATASSEEAFIKQLYTKVRGLVIGESHLDTSSKQFLINHMKLLKKEGVETLYLEHLLTDLHQAELELFYRTSKMPKNLKRYLSAQDAGHMRGYTGPDTYTQVVKAANKAGIRVRALDCTASYHVKRMYGDKARMNLFSYFANEVIKADQLAQGPHRWVALMGDSHCDMYLGVPGIAQLQDGVSLRIRDVHPTQALPLQRGGWELVEAQIGSPGTKALRSDFKLHVGITGMRAPFPKPAPDRAWLRNVDDFLIEQPSASQANVLHRSDSGAIVSTPIQITDTGQFFVERWPQLQGRTYMTLDNLVEQLKTAVNLSPVSRASLPSEQLTIVGEFLIERPSANHAHLLSRSITGELRTHPVKRDATGQFYVEDFLLLKDNRYLSMEDLLDAIESDLNLTVIPSKMSPRARLRTAGDFLIQRRSGGHMNLLHRSRTGDIVSSPIRVDTSGQLLIDRWDQLRGTPFANVGALIEALKRTLNMLPAF